MCKLSLILIVTFFTSPKPYPKVKEPLANPKPYHFNRYGTRDQCSIIITQRSWQIFERSLPKTKTPPELNRPCRTNTVNYRSPPSYPAILIRHFSGPSTATILSTEAIPGAQMSSFPKYGTFDRRRSCAAHQLLEPSISRGPARAHFRTQCSDGQERNSNYKSFLFSFGSPCARSSPIRDAGTFVTGRRGPAGTASIARNAARTFCSLPLPERIFTPSRRPPRGTQG